MKTVLYNKNTGTIVDFIDEEVELSGLGTDITYVKSATAAGTETNISEITDGIRPKRIIDGCLISSVTKAELENATTLEELKTFLSDILFGN